MKQTEFTCSACGSANLRRSHSTSVLELPKMALGTYPFRCLDCRERFWLNIWFSARGKCAMCPRCLICEVMPVPKESIRLTLRKRLLLGIGAHAFRCSVCRHSFISFKRAEPSRRISQQPQPPKAQTAEPEVASAATAGK